MASSQEEWQRYQEAMRRGDMLAAAAAFQRYLDAKKAEGKGSSRPMLVSLGYRKTYPSAIPLENIPDELVKNPEFFALLQRLSEKK